jgi:catechol 2,3-dioxygenase-like lactoylglutathione lyase family enzyme
MKFGHMDIGVRYDTSSPQAAMALRRALAFWTTILDMQFHEQADGGCALAVVDATPGILNEHNDVARAQFTDWDNFQGWIAFDPHISQYMSEDELYATAVHELGHIFGLFHSNHANSVMFYIDADSRSILDEADLHALAGRHSLRSRLRGPIPVLQ